jgi:hypothetical protein
MLAIAKSTATTVAPLLLAHQSGAADLANFVLAFLRVDWLTIKLKQKQRAGLFFSKDSSASYLA